MLRVPTSEGDVYFKAAIPGLAHDAAVTVTLARIRPDLVLAPLAVKLEPGWMLLPDGGERLREAIALERHPRRWLEIAPLYAELQIAAAPHVDELVRAGLPDYRLALLSGLAEQLAANLEVAAPARARVEALCRELAAVGVPESVQHDDFHDANIFVRADAGYAFFDWGDACVSHPFASLVILLRGVAHRFELAERDPELELIRDAYLEPWSRFADRAALLRAVELADTVGKLSRALAWSRLVGDVDEFGAADATESGRSWFEEFRQALSYS